MTSDDAWAILLGGSALAVFLLFSVLRQLLPEWHPGPMLTAPANWSNRLVESVNPADARYTLLGIARVFAITWLAFSFSSRFQLRAGRRTFWGYPIVFACALLAYVVSTHSVAQQYGLENAVWALLIGTVISNTIGTPALARTAVRGELYLKTGLILLGAEVLIAKLMALGVPGIFVAWIVTPVVLITTFWFGQRILRMESASLNMVISADMSVCGVSAAIATAAACRAKKEELSLAIGLSLSFTVVMMVLLPIAIRTLGISPVVGGAWIGGTIDSTGAVGVAGAMLGEVGLTVATTIKMIQNVLIGFVSLGVALYWSKYQGAEGESVRVDVGEIWRRFPKFVLGFLAASIFFSGLYALPTIGESVVAGTIAETKILRGWLFCLAFVSIGLDIRFVELQRLLRGGKPVILYASGQTLNLMLTLFMAWLMFERIFPHTAQVLIK